MERSLRRGSIQQEWGRIIRHLAIWDGTLRGSVPLLWPCGPRNGLLPAVI